MARVSDHYLSAIDRALYSLDAGIQYGFLNSLIRSVLQTAAFAALDFCHEEVDDIEQTDVPDLASALLVPADGSPPRVLNACIPIIQQTGWSSCCRAWFMPASDGPGAASSLLTRRVDAWVAYRNNRPAHGVVSEDTIREALAWLPSFARNLVEGLADLLPEVAPDGSLQLVDGRESAPSVVTLPSMRLHDNAIPIVVRAIALRGPSWRVTYQSLDASSSQEAYYELAPTAPLIALTRLEKRLYRACTVSSAPVWKPLVLLPARQTAVFEGRRRELEELGRWMNDTDSRACNVFGDGGIGKTTLVVEYLHAILAGHADVPS